MKRILLIVPAYLGMLLYSGCASMLLSAVGVPIHGNWRGSGGGGGIDPVTQSAIDDSARQTQEDVQRNSDWAMEQQVQATTDAANQESIQATMDASNAAAQSALDAAASVPPVNP